jgi:hypothetical protein
VYLYVTLRRTCVSALGHVSVCLNRHQAKHMTIKHKSSCVQCNTYCTSGCSVVSCSILVRPH